MATHSGKRTQLTIALSLVLLGLMATIAWMEFGGIPSDNQKAKSVDTIVITRKGHEDITLIRDAATWRMSTPYALNANAQRIEPLLSLSQSTFNGYAASDVDLPATGLTQPAASVTFDERTFQLGNTDVDGERRYTMVDDQVGFVPAWVWSLVHGGVTAFADLTVFDNLPAALYLADGDTVRALSNNALWKDLQADNIIPWSDKLQSDAQTSTNGPHILFLRTTNNENTGEVLATIIRTSDYAVISTQPDFAYAISEERLDTLLNP